MDAIQEYKKAVEQVSQMGEVFGNVIDTNLDLMKSMIDVWTLDLIKNYYIKWFEYYPEESIKEKLIGDFPDNTTLKRRLDNIRMELPDTYFVMFYEPYYSYKNKLLVEALERVAGRDWAFKMVQQLGNVVMWANAKIRRTWQMLQEVCEFAGYEQNEEAPEPQQIATKLTTPEAKAYFRKAIKLGLMDSNYNWRKGLQMLACFAREMSLRLNMGKGENSDGTKRISWQPFETLFSIDAGKLRSNYNDIQKTGQQPTDSYLIDKVFE